MRSRSTIIFATPVEHDLDIVLVGESRPHVLVQRRVMARDDQQMARVTGPAARSLTDRRRPGRPPLHSFSLIPRQRDRSRRRWPVHKPRLSSRAKKNAQMCPGHRGCPRFAVRRADREARLPEPGARQTGKGTRPPDAPRTVTVPPTLTGSRRSCHCGTPENPGMCEAESSWRRPERPVTHAVLATPTDQGGNIQ